MNIYGNTTISNGGSITAKGALTVNVGGNLTVESNAGKILLGDAGSTYYGRVMLNGGTLTINKTNAFERDAASPFCNVILTASSTMNLNGANNFGQLYYSTGAKFTLNLSDNMADVISFTSFNSIAEGASAKLYIEDFENNRVFFASNYAPNLSKLTISGISADGQTYTNSDFELVAGNYSGNNGYWLNVVVPEPAEWAAIFGAIALAFAAYRRRK